MAAPQDQADEAFLDQVFECAFARMENGEPVAVEEFAAERPGLRDRIAALLAEAAAALPRPLPPTRGPTVPGHELVRLVGRGGMGAVYLARHLALGREVAVKVLPASDALSPHARQRFLAEARALAGVSHPHVVRVHDVFETDGLCAFTMDFVAGSTLKERMDTSAADPDWVSTVVRIGAEIAEALAAVHAHGLVHRDVKPGNVLVRDDGTAVLSDFGLVRDQHSVTQRTAAGQFLGTVLYAAPEQLRGDHAAVGVRTDVYALGATLYHALARTPPFAGDRPSRLLQQIEHGTVRPLRLLAPWVPRDLALVVGKAMAPEPSERYPHAAALAADLRSVLALRPVTAPAPGLARRLWRACRRHAALVAAATSAALALTMVGSWFAVAAAEVNRTEQLARDRAVVPALVAALPGVMPGSRPAALGEWLDLARSVVARRSAHEALGVRIEGRATPTSRPATRPADALLQREREEEQVWHLSRGLRGSIEEHNADWLRHFTNGLRARLAAAPPPASRPALAFATPEDEELAGMVRDLLPRLDQLVAVMPSVEHRIADLTAAAQRERDAGVAAWRGVPELPPQPGLVPLGRDPESRLLEFAHLASGVPPVRDPATGRLRMEEQSSLVLVLIPGGRVTVGADVPPDGAADGTEHLDRLADPSERTEQVLLDPFFLSKFEMTQAQWQRVTGQNPSWFRPGTTCDGRTFTALHPVEMLTPDQAVQVLSGLGLALPTEAQWEHACRGGTTTRYWTGAEAASLEGAENLEDAGSALRAGTPRKDVATAVRRGDMVRWDDGWLKHAPVGSFRANPFGLFDMLGNVSEMVMDLAPPLGPRAARGPLRPGDGLRQAPATSWTPNLRGGAFQLPLSFARASAHQSWVPGFCHTRSGVRPARAVSR